MSFFGLTRLGHERPFFSNTDGAYALNIFDDEEFGIAFETKAFEIPQGTTALRTILENLYHGPFVPNTVHRELHRELGSEHDFTKDDFMLACRKLNRRCQLSRPNRRFSPPPKLDLSQTWPILEFV